MGTGEAVQFLQTLLNKHSRSTLDVDGIFGPETEDTVKTFQQNHNLSVDGVVGPKTWAALNN
ncbi:MAG: peptidoglycan-binding domain-containing protein [Rhizonema sp. NSF051]|nr:peptidoglycan-binding domain-containing protein [Rhizonema sp. NSF051]